MEVQLAPYGTNAATNWIAACTDLVAATNKELGKLYGTIRKFSEMLAAAGFPQGAIMRSVAQVLLESAFGTSSVARNLNNYSGIKFINNPAVQKAAQGTRAPDGGYYAKYSSPAAWAQDYKRVLSLNTGKLGTPLTAANIDQFLDRLQANKYFTDPDYRHKYNKVFNTMYEAVKWYNEGGMNKPIDIDYTHGQGNPNNKVDTITPGTETVIYSNDPEGRTDKDGNPTGMKLFPDLRLPGSLKEWEAWGKEHPILLAILLGGSALVLKKLFSK